MRLPPEVEGAREVAHLVEATAQEEETVRREMLVPPSGVGQRLDVFLASAIEGVSRSQLGRHIGQGAVTVNGSASAPSRKLRAGYLIVLTPPPVVTAGRMLRPRPTENSGRPVSIPARLVCVTWYWRAGNAHRSVSSSR